MISSAELPAGVAAAPLSSTGCRVPHPNVAYFATLGWALRSPDEDNHIWQKRFYDFNVFTERKRVQKLRYIHRNPVARGLVESPELWRWSSYRAYAFGEEGPVKVNEWQVLKMKIRPPAA